MQKNYIKAKQLYFFKISSFNNFIKKYKFFLILILIKNY